LGGIRLISIFLHDGFPFHRQPFVSPTKITWIFFFLLKGRHHLVTFTRKCLLFDAAKTPLFFMRLRMKRERIWSPLWNNFPRSVNFMYSTKKFALTNRNFQRICYEKKITERRRSFSLNFQIKLQIIYQKYDRHFEIRAPFSKWELMYNVSRQFIVSLFFTERKLFLCHSLMATFLMHPFSSTLFLSRRFL